MEIKICQRDKHPTNDQKKPNANNGSATQWENSIPRIDSRLAYNVYFSKCTLTTAKVYAVITYVWKISDIFRHTVFAIFCLLLLFVYVFRLIFRPVSLETQDIYM